MHVASLRSTAVYLGTEEVWTGLSLMQTSNVFSSLETNEQTYISTPGIHLKGWLVCMLILLIYTIP